MDSVVLKNHLGIDLFLHNDTFQNLIDEDVTRANILEYLKDLFSNPDEIWENTLEGDENIIVYKYIKFFRTAAIFGIVDVNDIMDLKIIDFYKINSDEVVNVDGQSVCKIDYERNGILIKSKFYN